MRASSSGTARSTSTGSGGDDPFVLFLQIFIPTFIALFLISLPSLSRDEVSALGGIFLIVIGLIAIIRPEAYIKLTKKLIERWFT